MLWWELKVSGLSAELGPKRFSGAVAGLKRQIQQEIFERFGNGWRHRWQDWLWTRRLAPLGQSGAQGSVLLRKIFD